MFPESNIKEMSSLKFVDLNYRPTSNDLICLFRVTPNRVSIKEAANIVALESSVGTWVEVKTKKDYVNKLAAKVFSIKGDMVKIAYPQGLFEGDNAPNILSSIAGNVFGMKVVNGLRLESVEFPQKLLKSFRGPRYGIPGIRRIMQVKNRPFVGTIIKPKLGLKTEDHAKAAYDSWIGGCDIVKDDENLSSQEFNRFEKRASKTLEMKDRAEQETGERKAYLINVTAETGEMLKRADLVKSLGGKFVMIDILTSGFAAVQTLRKNVTLAIHAHRAMHGAFTENKKHGISMLTIAEFARLIGVDTLHIGTAVGKMRGDFKEVRQIEDEIEFQRVKESYIRLKQNWSNIRPVMAVSSGGLCALNIPFLIKHFGIDQIIQAGGGVHGHPQGTVAGAKSLRQAVDASLKGISLKNYATNHPELEQALKKFG